MRCAASSAAQRMPSKQSHSASFVCPDCAVAGADLCRATGSAARFPKPGAPSQSGLPTCAHPAVASATFHANCPEKWHSRVVLSALLEALVSGTFGPQHER
jgi:hypothetical protein